MAQSKKQKQEKALNKLLAEFQGEKESRESLQNQTVSYYVIPPSQNEMRLSREINNLKRAMGLSFQDQESPF